MSYTDSSLFYVELFPPSSQVGLDFFHFACHLSSYHFDGCQEAPCCARSQVGTEEESSLSKSCSFLLLHHHGASNIELCAAFICDGNTEDGSVTGSRQETDEQQSIL